MNTMARRTTQAEKARVRRARVTRSRRNPINMDPMICANQYTRLFRERARMLKSASLYSLNSGYNMSALISGYTHVNARQA